MGYGRKEISTELGEIKRSSINLDPLPIWPALCSCLSGGLLQLMTAVLTLGHVALKALSPLMCVCVEVVLFFVPGL
jgi:hypothetical protein